MTTIAPNTAAEMTHCPVCKRQYAATGRSIHYCYPNHEYICHYDNQQVGVGYATYSRAEENLDDYCYWLAEQDLMDDPAALTTARYPSCPALCPSCGDPVTDPGPCAACRESDEQRR